MSLTLTHYLCALIFIGLNAPVLAACEPVGAPVLSLSVTTPMVSIADRTLTVQVYDNGCVALHRPSFYRAAGEFRVALTAAELLGLRELVRPERMRQIAPSAIALAPNARRSGARVEVLQELDADLYVLEAGVGAEATKLSGYGVIAGARAQVENANLQALSAMVQALLALDSNTAAQKVAGGAR